MPAPAHLGALNSRGDCLALLGQHEQAIAAYDKLLGSRPFDIGARNNRASALKSAGRLDEAVTEYDAVLSADPNHAEWEAVVEQVKKVIRQKVLDSYRNGQGAKSQPVRRVPRR